MPKSERDWGGLYRVETLDDLDVFRRWLGERRDWLGVDTETEGLNVGRDRVRLVQFGDSREGFALDFTLWRGAIKELLERYDGKTVWHNLLFDEKMLAAEDIRIPRHLAHDTMVMAKLINSAEPAHLKPLAAAIVDPRARAGQDALKLLFQMTGWNWATIPTNHPTYWQYGVLDTVLTAALAEEMWPKVHPWRASYEMELGVIHTLVNAELRGMGIDLSYTQRAIDHLQARLDEIRPYIPCDPGSDQQVISWLLSHGARLTKRTEKGNLSIDKDVLKSIEAEIPLAGTIREWREKKRLITAYLQKFLDLQVGGRLYHNNHPLAARTGRMSVTEPPLQQLPRGRIVRDAFVAAPGHVLLKADFEQQELRVMASYANEEQMLEQFRMGQDLHRWVAASVYGIAPEDVAKPQRSIAKNAQFAKIYGAGAEKFALTADISLAIAEQFVQRYDTLFPGVSRWQQATIAHVRANAEGKYGYVTAVDGRRLMVDKDKAYAGCNYLIQGSCAIITKQQMLSCVNAGLGDFFRLSVHDELLFEVPEEHAVEVKAIVDETMPDRTTFQVPLTIESETTPRWGMAYEEDYGPPIIPLESPMEGRTW